MDRSEPVLSWSAILAGAVVTLAAAILLTVLADGFGLTLIFGGLASRGSLGAFTPIMGALAIAIQVIAAGLGGYMAGRLRHAWLRAHSDEAHFRDTAHGLIAWALSTLAGVVLAAALLTPYAETLAPPAEAAVSPDIAAQAALFMAVGMLLSAFIAAVAARIGGLRTEEMHAKGQA